MKRLLAILAVICPFVCFASEPWSYDNNFCDQQGCISFGVECLFLKPCIQDPYFLVQESTVTNDPLGTRYANNLPFHWGARVKGSYNLSCSGIELYGEGFGLRDSEKRNILVSPEGVAPLSLGTKGHPSADENSVQRASSRISYAIWSAKGGFRRCFDTCCPFMAAGRFAIHYAQLRLREKIFYDEIANTVTEDSTSNSWGIGPELGLDLGYTFLPCLSFVVRGSYALLVGDAKSRTSTEDIAVDPTDSEDIRASNERHCIVFPVSEMKVGFLYDLPFQCASVNLEVGYDVIRYTDLYDRIRWVGAGDQAEVSGAEGLSFDHVTAFMVHGAYVSLGISF